jgi:hypothetical protein
MTLSAETDKLNCHKMYGVSGRDNGALALSNDAVGVRTAQDPCRSLRIDGATAHGAPAD